MGKRLTTEQFIEKAKAVHGGKYDYSQVEYVNNKTPVKIFCKRHGCYFYLRPDNHICLKQGCPECKFDKISKGTKQFIIDAISVHGGKYDYSQVKYVNNKTKVKIICPIHGEFEQKPCRHLQGRGCRKCGGTAKSNTNEFIKKAKSIYGDLYVYDEVEYITNDVPVNIICPKHGKFEKTPAKHLSGQGCPVCKQSVLERDIYNLLVDNKVLFYSQYRPEWLPNNMSLDFYLPDYNVAIECQGVQHFQPVDFFGGQSNFEDVLLRDELKKKLCFENNVLLLYYSNKHNVPGDWDGYELFYDRYKLLEYIFER